MMPMPTPFGGYVEKPVCVSSTCLVSVHRNRSNASQEHCRNGAPFADLPAPLMPLIIDTGYGLLGAKSWALWEKRLAKITFPDMAPRDVIDSTAEAFSLYPEHLVFSPLTLKKRWTKAAIIDLYNSQRETGRPEYPTTSLGNKSLEKVVKDIVELLVAPAPPQAVGVVRQKTI